MSPPEKDTVKDLVEKNLDLVKRNADIMAARTRHEVSAGELMGYGAEGLMRAAELFDPDKGVSFRTYAHYRIRGALLDGMKAVRGMPSKVSERMKFYESADAYLENEASKAAPRDTASAARALGAGLGALVTSFVLMNHAKTEKAIDSESMNAEDACISREAYDHIQKGIEKLKEKHKKVIHLYYMEDMSLVDIAGMMRMHKSTISRIHAEALGRLRKHVERKYPGTVDLKKRQGGRSG